MDNARSMIIKKTLLFWVPGIILFSFLASYTASRIYNDRKDPVVVEEGYQYENKDLGFMLFLPKEFEYFQTQRADSDSFKILEIFVPTSDLEYPQEVPGYAKPIQVIIGNKADIEAMKESDIERDKIFIIGEYSGNSYAIKFWPNVPKDWVAKWNEQMKDNILKMAKLGI